MDLPYNIIAQNLYLSSILFWGGNYANRTLLAMTKRPYKTFLSACPYRTIGSKNDKVFCRSLP